MFTHIAEKLSTFEMFVDISFLIDIILNFVKLPPDSNSAADEYSNEISLQQLLSPRQQDKNKREDAVDKQLRQVQWKYLKGYFILDCIATLPGLLTLERGHIFYFKLVRLVHWNRMFEQLNFIFEKVLLSWLAYNRHKVSELITFIKLIVFLFLTTHVLACGWIAIGRLSETSWVHLMGEAEDSAYDVYWMAFFFVLTAITTVGYGEGVGST